MKYKVKRHFSYRPGKGFHKSKKLYYYKKFKYGVFSPLKKKRR